MRMKKVAYRADLRRDEKFNFEHYKLEMSVTHAYVHKARVWERNLNKIYAGR